MRTVTVRLHCPGQPLRLIPSATGEMEGFSRGPIHHVELLSDGTAVCLRSVSGDLETYRERSEALDAMHEVVTSGGKEGFIYGHYDPSPGTKRLLEWRRQTALLAEMPMLVEGDHTLVVTFVGEEGSFADELGTLPEGVEYDVVSTGAYDGVGTSFFEPLTTTQRGVLATAVDAGYYAYPREVTQAEVAERLGLSPSTVAEHLQKIEARLLCRFEAETG